MNAVTPNGSGFGVPANRWDLLSHMPARLVRVAVVVPYYNQQDQLDLVITALDGQDYPLDLLQIVVADDGSTRAPSIVTARVPITVVRQEDRGFRAAAARNLGVAHADADVLCFLDADTVPQRDYVRRITKLPSLCPEALVVGRRRHADFSQWTPQRLRDWWAGGQPPTELDEPRWLTDEYARSRNLLDLDDRSYRYIISSVMCCTATLFDDIGGFDETFQQYGGEDWEFAHRAITGGAVLQHARDAVAWHHGPDWAGRELDDRAEIKRAETQAVARLVPDPDLRVPGRAYDIPAVAVQVDADGHDVSSLSASVGYLLDFDVGICVRGADSERLLTALQLDDPRIHCGPISSDVLRRCRYVIAAAGRTLLSRAGVDDLLSRCGHGSVGAVTVRTGQAQVTCAASWARNRALRRDPAPRRMIDAMELAQLTQAIDVTAETGRLTHAAPRHPG